MKLWLDDLRPAPKGWLLAATAQEAIQLLGNGNIQQLSLTTTWESRHQSLVAAIRLRYGLKSRLTSETGLSFQTLLPFTRPIRLDAKTCRRRSTRLNDSDPFNRLNIRGVSVDC